MTEVVPRTDVVMHIRDSVIYVGVGAGPSDLQILNTPKNGASQEIISARVNGISDVPHGSSNVPTSKKGKRHFVAYLVLAIVLASVAVGAVYLFHVKQKTVVTTDAYVLQGAQTIPEQQLRDVVISKGLTVYWLGPRAGATYVLNTSLANGISLRAINTSSGISDSIQTYYEIGTYVSPNAFDVTQKAALQPYGAGFINVDGNSVYYDTRDPKNVYVGLKGLNIEVEIYDPRTGQALAAALMQGNIKRIV